MKRIILAASAIATVVLSTGVALAQTVSCPQALTVQSVRSGSLFETNAGELKAIKHSHGIQFHSVFIDRGIARCIYISEQGPIAISLRTQYKKAKPEAPSHADTNHSLYSSLGSWNGPACQSANADSCSFKILS